MTSPGSEAVAAGYEILPHTAEVGIRSWGSSLAEAFEQAAWGLADILGATASGAGEARTIRASGSDEGALLVDFLNELLFVHESEEVAFSGIRIARLSETDLEAEVTVVPLSGEPVGTAVKAATYHQLAVDRRPSGVEARVYLDV